VENSTADNSADQPASYPTLSLMGVEEGNGSPPLLLLHGWGGNEQTLHLISDRIAGHRRTIRISLPGFGRSPEPPAPWGTWDYVDTVRRWILEHFPNQALDVVAHSFGGRIAVGLSARHPQLVNRLVLIASAGLRPKRSLNVKIKRLYSKQLRMLGGLLGGQIAAKLEIARQQLGSEDWRKASLLMRGTLSKVLDEDLSCEMKAITRPTLLLWGRRDTATPLWMGRAMELLIPDAKLVVIEKAGHYCYIDQPGDTIAAIWKHLELPEAW